LENVKIKITTTQTVDDAGNEDIIELVTEAVQETTEDCITINYDESAITESEGTRTRLKIFKNRMIMTKVGTFSSKMEFEENKNYTNLYQTPYGTFDLDFNTVVYKNNLDASGKGSIYVEYKIIFGKTEENYNKLKIDIF
jgi:uncharacterized beta-barrel protein YwiB (DUF1934 family)